MNKRKIIAFGAVVVLIGLAAGVILEIKSRQKPGRPGLKLVQKPALGERGQALGEMSVELPEKVLDYTSTNLSVSDIELDYLPKDTTYGRRRYVKPDQFWSDISVVLMGTDRTSIHKPQICLTGQGWKIEKSELVTISIERPHRYELPVMKLTTAGRSWKLPDGRVEELRAIYAYWFVSENRITAEHKERMWGTVEDMFKTGVMPRWAYVSCFSICRPGQEEAAYQRMEKLISEAVPEFQLTTLPATEGRLQTTAAAH